MSPGTFMNRQVCWRCHRLCKDGFLRTTTVTARMEYHCNTDANIGTKIFELGLKAFPDDVAFAVKFLEFLIQINDDSST
jgi:hypothetical protein